MRLHFIAIGGSAMHNLAIALSKKGYLIAGSDDAIFEPSCSRLAQYGLLPEKMGWDKTHITADIDAVILGMHARTDNPELLRAQELGLKIYSYPEYIFEQSKNKLRIVVGGSHGKTTITSMIMHVLNKCNKQFDYLVGAQLEGFETMVKLTDEAPVIIIEGDEYLASAIDRRPKFHLYHANIAILSGISWDHINVFPTFDIYVDQFKLFLKTIEQPGILIYCTEDQVLNEIVEKSTEDLKKIPYGVPDFRISGGITELKAGTGYIPLKIFGKHNLLNLSAAKLVCDQLGINNAEFYTAIANFKGASRRLELLGENDYTAVYKDFAHSPSKLKATIQAVKEQYPERGLIAVIELHTFSSLNESFLKEYHGSMELSDEAIVFISAHTFEQKKMQPFDQNTVKKAFGNRELKFFNDREILEVFLSCINYKGKNLLLMSSGNFSGIDLDQLTSKVLSE